MSSSWKADNSMVIIKLLKNWNANLPKDFQELKLT